MFSKKIANLLSGCGLAKICHDAGSEKLRPPPAEHPAQTSNARSAEEWVSCATADGAAFLLLFLLLGRYPTLFRRARTTSVRGPAGIMAGQLPRLTSVGRGGLNCKATLRVQHRAARAEGPLFCAQRPLLVGAGVAITHHHPRTFPVLDSDAVTLVGSWVQVAV